MRLPRGVRVAFGAATAAAAVATTLYAVDESKSSNEDSPTIYGEAIEVDEPEPVISVEDPA